MRPTALAILAIAIMPIGGCDQLVSKSDKDRPESARVFLSADRPVAHIESTRWSNEDSRDRPNEADDIIIRAGRRLGIPLADIGAGAGYYAVWLARAVDPRGGVAYPDILP